MRRCCSAAITVLVLASCASQPICPPWPGASGAPAAVPTSAGLEPAPIVDDGTVALAGPADDEAWGSVVGTQVMTAAATHGGAAASIDHHAPAASRPSTKPRRPRRAAAPTVAAAAPAAARTAPAAARPPTAPPVDDAMAAKARAFYAGRCVPCHGTSGRGDGPTGKVLDPHPRNFTDRAWQRSVTDQHIEKVILQGGPSVGKSPLMPAHGDLASDRALLAAMRRMIRDFGR